MHLSPECIEAKNKTTIETFAAGNLRTILFHFIIIIIIIFAKWRNTNKTQYKITKPIVQRVQYSFHKRRNRVGMKNRIELHHTPHGRRGTFALMTNL